MKRRQLRYDRRSDNGSIAALAFIALVPLIAAIGGFAVDCMHVNDEKGALQRATDAGALSGAEDLFRYVGKGGLQSTNTVQAANNEEPINYALMLTSMNAVDGQQGVYTSAAIQRTVTATLLRADGAAISSNKRPDRCQVDATIVINSLFSMMFGSMSQTINTHSMAGIGGPAGGGTIDTLLGYFPMVVSSSDVDGLGDPALGTNPVVGSLFTFVMRANSSWITGQPGAGGTSNLINIINSLVSNGTGIPPGSEVPLVVNQTYPINHGTRWPVEDTIADDLVAASAPGTILTIPVSDTPGLGMGNSAHITGFISILVPPQAWTAGTGGADTTPGNVRVGGIILGQMAGNGLSTGIATTAGQNNLLTVHLVQ